MKFPDIAFKEAMVRDPEVGQAGWDRLISQAQQHRIIGRALKEGLYPDAASALAGMQTSILAPVYPAFISREILRVIPTTRTGERFYKGKAGYVAQQGAQPLVIGPKATYVDINANMVFTSKQEWNADFAEDVAWNVAAFESEHIGKDIAKQENTQLNTLLEAVASGDLAGGAEVTITDNAPTWAQITAGIGKLMAIDRYPTHIVMNPAEFTNLFALQEFMNGLYNETGTGPEGVWFHQKTGIKFMANSSITSVEFIDANRLGVLLLRSDAQIVPYQDNANFVYGLTGRERLGMGVIDSLSLVRGTN